MPHTRLQGEEAVVLLVDGQASFGDSVRDMLGGERDIKFHFVSRAEDALAAAAAIRPSVIIQDLAMPGADALGMISAYRAQEATRLTPLIALATADGPEARTEAFRRGASDFLVKDPGPVELVARIRYHARTYRLLVREKALGDAERAHLVAERQADALRARNTLIFALAKLADSRDHDTGQHLERIAAYCRVLAEEVRASDRAITDTWILQLQLASALHDIGKVGIPDRVLLKPGKLDPQERAEMERHAAIGADALDAILAQSGGDDLLRMARNIAAHHHERWDGQGYPDGLAGVGIPLEARIVAVADVYDALTSPRVYKVAMPHEQALRIITEGRATQFDPAVVDALVRCELVFRLSGELLQGGPAVADLGVEMSPVPEESDAPAPP